MTEFKTLTESQLEKITGGKSIIEISTCLMSIAPELPAVQSVIQYLEQGDYSNALKCLQQLVQEGHTELYKCLN